MPRDLAKKNGATTTVKPTEEDRLVGELADLVTTNRDRFVELVLQAAASYCLQRNQRFANLTKPEPVQTPS